MFVAVFILMYVKSSAFRIRTGWIYSVGDKDNLVQEFLAQSERPFLVNLKKPIDHVTYKYEGISLMVRKHGLRSLLMLWQNQ